MKTKQEQRQAIRQILFDANDICQATPCENEYCIYHGDYRCYDNVIVDKLINAGYGDVTEYKAEIERLKKENEQRRKLGILGNEVTVEFLDDVVSEPSADCKDIEKYAKQFRIA